MSIENTQSCASRRIILSCSFVVETILHGTQPNIFDKYCLHLLWNKTFHPELLRERSKMACKAAATQSGYIAIPPTLCRSSRVIFCAIKFRKQKASQQNEIQRSSWDFSWKTHSFWPLSFVDCEVFGWHSGMDKISVCQVLHNLFLFMHHCIAGRHRFVCKKVDWAAFSINCRPPTPPDKFSEIFTKFSTTNIHCSNGL